MTKTEHDPKAQYGYAPNWRRQRKKQEAMAEGFYDDYESNMETEDYE